MRQLVEFHWKDGRREWMHADTSFEIWSVALPAPPARRGHNDIVHIVDIKVVDFRRRRLRKRFDEWFIYEEV